MRVKAADMIGVKYGRLLVTGVANLSTVGPEGKNNFCKLACRCECGKETTVFSSSLLRKKHPSRSCGCLTVEATKARLKTHGMSDTFEYKLLRSMIDRCHNPASKKYPLYGARGISVFDLWRTKPHTFVNYVREEMGSKPEGCSLDRIDNNKGYEPGNIRWASVKVQNRNARSNRNLEFNGVTMLLTDWATHLGITKSTLSYRLKKWELEKALTTPAATGKS